MENDFWINRWKNRDTGWHQSEVEPALADWASQLKPARVFVPLCGKSLDLIWLREHGFEVAGIELSVDACEAFFSENKLPFKKRTHGALTVYDSSGLTLFNGDFFALTPEQLGKVGAVYDRAALIALPQKVRSQYVVHLQRLIKPSLGDPDFQFLQILLTRNPQDSEGPPFSVTLEEINNLYGQSFTIKTISREKYDAKGPSKSESHESVFIFTPK